jgi:starch phosphorylase
VIAKAYDNPIPGFKTPTVGNLRLWEALPVEEFDLSAFNEGKYDKVVRSSSRWSLWPVLYETLWPSAAEFWTALAFSLQTWPIA